jgi:serine O-acetyltransferase
MTALSLAIGSQARLAHHVARQLDNLFPQEGIAFDADALAPSIPQALARLRPILAAVRGFETDRFNHFNSLQYASWLYLLANEVWRRDGHAVLAERLFCLNRALNAIDLFYAVEMPPVFFLSHGLGAVLGNAVYGDRLVVFQHVTVGRVGAERPSIGRDVVLYPGAVVTGASVIGDGCVVSAGTVLHGVQMPPGTLAVMAGGRPSFIPRRKDYTGLYLHPA